MAATAHSLHAMSELGFFPAYFTAVSAKCVLLLPHCKNVTFFACMARPGLRAFLSLFSRLSCAFTCVPFVSSAKKCDVIIMYTVFAELPGGSGALFGNLVNGAILLTVRAPRYRHRVVAHDFHACFRNFAALCSTNP